MHFLIKHCILHRAYCTRSNSDSLHFCRLLIILRLTSCITMCIVFSTRASIPTTQLSVKFSPGSIHVNIHSLSAGIETFRTFLQSEFSEENLDFWLECESYRQQKPHRIHKHALKIFHTYLEVNAPKEVSSAAA